MQRPSSSPADPSDPTRTSAADALSLIALLAANLVPLIGVLAFDWAVGDVMLVYWAESAVIGFWNLVKMWIVGRWAGLGLGLFFVVHYGGFMAGHFVFLWTLFLTDLPGAAGMEDGVEDLAVLLGSLWYLLPAVLALFVSHGISFFLNFIGRREYEARSVGEQMNAPYGRIIVMHLTILFGGMLTMFVENATPALLLMIALKVIVDVHAHRKSHRRARRGDEAGEGRAEFEISSGGMAVGGTGGGWRSGRGRDGD